MIILKLKYNRINSFNLEHIKLVVLLFNTYFKLNTIEIYLGVFNN